MKTLIILGMLFGGQMRTLEPKPVVHLKLHRDVIDVAFGGKVLELIAAPSSVGLPLKPPKQDQNGVDWVLDVKNLGPRIVFLSGKGLEHAAIQVGETVHVQSNGAAYMLMR